MSQREAFQANDRVRDKRLFGQTFTVFEKHDIPPFWTLRDDNGTWNFIQEQHLVLVSSASREEEKEEPEKEKKPFVNLLIGTADNPCVDWSYLRDVK